MPIRGFEDISADAMHALAKAGHGRRLIIADRSLDIGDNENEVHSGNGSAAAVLRASIKAVYREGPFTLMVPDEGNDTELGARAMKAFQGALVGTLGSHSMGEGAPFLRAYRNLAVDDLGYSDASFYDLLNDPDERRLVLRTTDPNPYACASFVVGHAQTGLPVNPVPQFFD